MRKSQRAYHAHQFAGCEDSAGDRRAQARDDEQYGAKRTDERWQSPDLAGCEHQMECQVERFTGRHTERHREHHMKDSRERTRDESERYAENDR